VLYSLEYFGAFCGIMLWNVVMRVDGVHWDPDYFKIQMPEWNDGQMMEQNGN
jgi:hypothetical protein